MKKSRKSRYLAVICVILLCLGVSASVMAAKAAAAGQPEAPQGVSVTRKSDKSLRLRWKSVKGASGYVISRKEQGKKRYKQVKTLDSFM